MCKKKQLNINMNQNLMTNELVFVECMVAQFLMPDFVQWINRIKGMGVSLLFCKKNKIEINLSSHDLIFPQKLTLCVDDLV